MSWLFNPPEPYVEPVRSGPDENGEGDNSPAVAPFYRLTVRWADSTLRTFTLDRLDTYSRFFADPDFRPLWSSSSVGRDNDIYGFRSSWVLSFGETHPGAFNVPRVPPHSWSLWFGPLYPEPAHRYPIWRNPAYYTLRNAFDPLWPSTWQGKVYPSESEDGFLFEWLPDTIELKPWFP